MNNDANNSTNEKTSLLGQLIKSLGVIIVVQFIYIVVKFFSYKRELDNENSIENRINKLEDLTNDIKLSLQSINANLNSYYSSNQSEKSTLMNPSSNNEENPSHSN